MLNTLTEVACYWTNQITEGLWQIQGKAFYFTAYADSTLKQNIVAFSYTQRKSPCSMFPSIMHRAFRNSSPRIAFSVLCHKNCYFISGLNKPKKEDREGQMNHTDV